LKISCDAVKDTAVNAWLMGAKSVKPFAPSKNCSSVTFVVWLVVVFVNGTVTISPISSKSLRVLLFPNVVERFAGMVRTASTTLIWMFWKLVVF